MQATTVRESGFTAFVAGRQSGKHMAVCPQRTFWQHVATMKKKQSELTLKFLRSTPRKCHIPLTYGHSKQDLRLSFLPTSTDLDGVIRQNELLFQSYITSLPQAAGLVVQLTDGSLSTSCPLGQLVLAGMPFEEAEYRVRLSKMHLVRSRYTGRGILPLPCLELQSDQLKQCCWPISRKSSDGSTQTKQGQAAGSSCESPLVHMDYSQLELRVSAILNTTTQTKSETT